MLLLVLAALGATPEAPRLPLTTLVLYENGLGYFERQGALASGGTAEIPLEPGQLDDALKTLVVVSPRGVASVEFAPPLGAEAARALAGMPSAEEQRKVEALLRSLMGVDVEVTRLDGVKVRGRVLELTDDETTLDKEGHPQPEPTLVVFGEAGLLKVPQRQLAGVRPVDSGVQKAWSRAASAMARQPEREMLRLRSPSGGGSVAVGYTTEAPVWRTTYRLVLSKGKPRLQGFALVHNDSDEPWNGVSVSIASGRPSSFLFPLAGPRYGRRELVAPEDGLLAAPQLASREAQDLLRGTDTAGSLVSGSLGLSGIGSGGGGAGMSIVGHGALGVEGHATSSSVVLEDGPTPLEPAAVSEAGDLFLYRVKEKVVLGARKSALLPIIDGPVTAERVTVLDAQGTALTGVRFTNSTPLTLEGGTLSVFTDGAFGGEARIDRVKPGEVRVVTHGQDLDVQVSRGQRRESGPPKKVAVVGPEGARQLEIARVVRAVTTLELTSRTQAARTLLVALTDERYRLASGGEEDVRSPGEPRYARVTLEPKASKTVELVDEGGVVERLAAQSLSSAAVRGLLETAPAGDAKRTLGRLLEELTSAEAQSAKAAQLEGRQKELEADLSRLRENLAAVGKAPEAGATAKRLGERLLALEDELAKVRREREQAARAADSIRRTLLAAR